MVDKKPKLEVLKSTYRGVVGKRSRQSMPRLTPIKILTRGKPWYAQAWIALTCSRKYSLSENFRVSMLSNGKYVSVDIPKGFICDGASIPRLLWWVSPPSGLLLVPGVVHDYAYAHAGLRIFIKCRGRYKLPNTGYIKFIKLNQSESDDLFNKISIEVNGCRIVSFVSWLSLRLFGWIAWNKHRRRENKKKKYVEKENYYCIFDDDASKPILFRFTTEAEQNKFVREMDESRKLNSNKCCKMTMRELYGAGWSEDTIQKATKNPKTAIECLKAMSWQIKKIS